MGHAVGVHTRAWVSIDAVVRVDHDPGGQDGVDDGGVCLLGPKLFHHRRHHGTHPVDRRHAGAVGLVRGVRVVRRRGVTKGL